MVVVKRYTFCGFLGRQGANEWTRLFVIHSCFKRVHSPSPWPSSRWTRVEEVKESDGKSKRKRRKRRRRKETPHLAGILPCNSCCYILFVCFWGTLRTSSPSPSPPTVPLPSVSPFLPRVKPHLDPGIWVRLYVYNLLRRRAHRGYLGLSSHLLRRMHNSQIELHAGAVSRPPRRSFFSERAPESLVKDDGSRNIDRLARHIQDLSSPY